MRKMYVSSIPKHCEVKWFNPVHCRLLGNQSISLTQKKVTRAKNFIRAFLQPATDKDEGFFPWRVWLSGV